jgi:hypothetical protein
VVVVVVVLYFFRMVYQAISRTYCIRPGGEM